MDAVSKLRELADNIERAEERLPDFEREAREFRDRVRAANDQRDAVEGDIAAVEEQVSTLRAEREDLKMQFANAQFEADVNAQRRITSRRKAIDSELQDHNQKLVSLREKLAGIGDFTGE